MDFPQYRKYKNIETYFKIVSEKEFEELKLVGKKIFRHAIIASQYPEILRIQDMLSCEGGTWEIIDENEYLEFANKL